MLKKIRIERCFCESLGVQGMAGQKVASLDAGFAFDLAKGFDHANALKVFPERLVFKPIDAGRLEIPVDLSVEYVDATALKARMHHPVDWLLLRDAG